MRGDTRMYWENNGIIVSYLRSLFDKFWSKKDHQSTIFLKAEDRLPYQITHNEKWKWLKNIINSKKNITFTLGNGCEHKILSKKDHFTFLMLQTHICWSNIWSYFLFQHEICQKSMICPARSTKNQMPSSNLVKND